MKIIAIAGDAGAGKSTLKDKLTELLPKDSEGYPNYQLMKFADPIYGMLHMISDLPIPVIQKDKNVLCKELNMTYREAMEKVGMAVRREIPDFWVASAQGWLELHGWLKEEEGEPEMVIIIDDLRFENEAKFLLSKGATLIFCEGDNSSLASSIELHLVKPLCHHVLKKEEQPKWNEWAEEFVRSNF